MGMTMAEKILARASGRENVRPGEFVTGQVDIMMGNDITFRDAIQNLLEVNLKKLADPDRVVVFLDHFVPAANGEQAENQNLVRRYVKDFKVKNFYDVGCGIEHVILPEMGHALPGYLIVGADSHTTTYGALGAAATGLGYTELAYAMYKGSLWFRVPETIRFQLDGALAPGVSSKDAMLALMAQHGTEKAQYKSIEFCGTAAQAMSIQARMTMSNIGVEMGAKFSFFATDEKTLEYLRPRTDKAIDQLGPDEDAEYAETHHLDCANLEPQIALPHNPDNVKPITELGEISVQQAFIGSCTNARSEDLELAAAILKGHKVAEGTRLLVTPGSQETMREASKSGALGIFIEAGAMIGPPGCGPCGGSSAGVLGPGENGIACTNRNFKGRMGSTESFNHLASPQTVAASAIEGRIADPRKYL